MPTPAPIKLAKAMSRARPVMREMSVIPPVTTVDRISLRDMSGKNAQKPVSINELLPGRIRDAILPGPGLTKPGKIRIVARPKTQMSKEFPLANTAQAKKRARQAETHRAGNGIIHKNAAARYKSNLNVRLRAMA